MQKYANSCISSFHKIIKIPHALCYHLLLFPIPVVATQSHWPNLGRISQSSRHAGLNLPFTAAMVNHFIFVWFRAPMQSFKTSSWGSVKHSPNPTHAHSSAEGKGGSRQQNAHAFASRTPNAHIRRLTCPQLTSRHTYTSRHTHAAHWKPAGYGTYPHYVSALPPLYYRWINLNREHLPVGATVAQEHYGTIPQDDPVRRKQKQHSLADTMYKQSRSHACHKGIQLHFFSTQILDGSEQSAIIPRPL